MIESFSEGFLLGIGAAMPLGPINILIMNNALKSYKAGFAIGLGAMSSDIFYLSLIMLGMIGFADNVLFLKSVGLIGAFFLLYLAYNIYKNRDKKVELSKEEDIKGTGFFKKYAQGFVLTLLNPYTIIFWFSIAGYGANRESDVLFTLLGMMSSIILWITLLPYLVHRTKHKVSQKVSLYLSVFSSLILLGFALSLLVDVVFT